MPTGTLSVLSSSPQSIKEKQNFRGVDLAMNIKPALVLRDDIKIMQTCLIPLLKNLNEVFKSPGPDVCGDGVNDQYRMRRQKNVIDVEAHDLGEEKVVSFVASQRSADYIARNPFTRHQYTSLVFHT